MNISALPFRGDWRPNTNNIVIILSSINHLYSTKSTAKHFGAGGETSAGYILISMDKSKFLRVD